MSVSRGAALAAGLVVGVGLLTGCAAKPGVAAVVDGRTITTAELATTTRELQELAPGAGFTSTMILTGLIQEPVVAKAADAVGVGATADEAKKLLAQAAAAQGTKVPTSAGSIAIGRLQLIEQKVKASTDATATSKVIAAALGKATVTVNPRFGRYDPDQAGVVDPTTPAWIYPTAAPAATAGPTP